MALDPQRQARFTLELGESLASGASTKRKYSDIKFNHKPSTSSSTRTTRITPGPSNTSTLSIRDANSEPYSYAGQQGAGTNSYVLIFDPKKQTCTLEPLNSSYVFNLQSTPAESSPAKVQAKYPPIPEQTGDNSQGGAGDASDEGSGDTPDPNNPFDYRHFINQLSEAAVSRSPSPSVRGDSPKSNATTVKAGTTSGLQTRTKPLPKPQILKQAKKIVKPATATPTVRLERRASARPGQTKFTAPASRAKAAPKSAEFVRDSSSSPEPVQAHELEPAAAPEPEPESEPERDLDVASEGEVDSDDDHDSAAAGGGLEIDFGDSGPPVKRSSVMRGRGTPLLGAAHGPISLRSAANSPNSLANTPRRRRQREEEQIDGFEIDMGEGSEYEGDSDGDDARGHGASQLETHHEEDEGDADEDVDVEPMSLAEQRPPHKSPSPQAVEEDDDDDMEAAFEAEMMQGLADDDDESEVSEAD